MEKVTLIQFQYLRSLPLGGLYLAYGLEEENIQFDLKTFNVPFRWRFDANRLYSFFAKTGEILAVGCWSDMLPYALVVLEKIKKNFPEKIIILGGVGTAGIARVIMKNFKFIDFVVNGCGIVPLPKLIKRILNKDTDFSGIGRLAYRHNQDIQIEGIQDFYSKSFIPDLPAYHRLKNINKYKAFTIFTSLGCPYKCTYCFFPSVCKGVYAFRDLNKVIGEIKFIRKLKGDNKFLINIGDEGFMSQRKRVVEFCNLIKDNKLDVKWSCYGRIDRMDEDLLKIISQSGCESIFYGIESGANRILQKIKKGFTVEEAIEILLLSKKYIKKIVASFIYLYPFETVVDFKSTLLTMEYLVLQNIDARVASLIPVRDSEIYLRYKKRLFLTDRILNTFHPRLSSMPRKCVDLIKNYPGIFCNYYFYKFKGLDKITNIAKKIKLGADLIYPS